MPIGDFPGAFTNAKTILIDPDYFEAVQVYTVKGTGEYLMIVESNSSPRKFTALTATDLGGNWTRQTTFASSSLASNLNNWTADISHGDIFRKNPDQTHTVDACNLQLLYQGRSPSDNPSDYNLRAYRPGLLTLNN